MKLLAAFLYPVKSMRAVAVDTLTLDAKGIVGDRRWMVVDANGAFVTQRTVPAMTHVQPALLADGVRLAVEGAAPLEVTTPAPDAPRRKVTVWRDTFDALDAGDAAARWLTAHLGFACRLVCFADDVRRAVDSTYAPDAETSFTDGYPLLITNEASLDALNATLPAPVPMARFRPNLVVRAPRAWAEDRWAALEVGGVTLEGVKPCARCVAITRDQQTGVQPAGSAPLTALAALHTLPGRGAIFGMNLVHRGHGTLRVGDEVRLTREADPVAARV